MQEEQEEQEVQEVQQEEQEEQEEWWGAFKPDLIQKIYILDIQNTLVDNTYIPLALSSPRWH